VSRSPKWRRTVAAALPLAAALAFSPAPTAGATDAFRVISTVDVRVNPFGATTAPDGKTVWVANSGPLSDHIGTTGQTVTVLDAKTFQIRSVIDVGLFPEDIAFTGHGRQAFVTNSTDGTVSVIRTATRTVTQTISLAGIPMTFPFGIVASRDGRKVFVTSVGDASPDSIAVLDNTNPARVRVGDTITVPTFTGRPALTPDGRLLVVPRGRAEALAPEIALIDPADNRVVADLRLGGQGVTQAATVAPNGRFAYISIFGGELGGDGGVWVVDLARRTTVKVIRTPGTEIFGVKTSPDGRYVFATDFSLDQVSVISTATNRIVANVPVGSNPNEVAFTLDGKRAFVTNQGDTTVSVIGLP
jgi:YVTN family beta-propeller protein